MNRMHLIGSLIKLNREHDNSYSRHFVRKPKLDISYKNETRYFVQRYNDVLTPCFYLTLIQILYEMSFVRNVGFLAIVRRNVVCMNSRGAK